MKHKSLLIVGILIVMVVAACGTAATPTSAPATSAPVVATEAPTSAPAPTAAPKPIRIAVIMPSATTDLAFSQSMYGALVQVQKDMGGEAFMEIAYTDNMFKVPDAAGG